MLVTEMQSPPSITSLTKILEDSLYSVGEGKRGTLHVDEIKSAAFLVYRAMTNRSRYYHDLSHLFDVAQGLPALGKLAAIYHDVVYFSVDRGISTEVNTILGDVVVFDDDRIFLTDSPDELVANVITIFGFIGGQELKQESGLNEFLSAVVAVRELRKFLTDQELWTVAACIEATIPFRPMVNGTPHYNLLGKRLGSLRHSAFTLTEEKIHDIKVLAVKIANADVQNFGNPDFGKFIENTWQLLSESNADFYHASGFSIRMYREELMRMKSFFTMLQPEVIFRHYGNTPNDVDYKALLECSRNHLRDALEYVNVSIATISIVEALAALNGGDAPLLYFMSATDSRIFHQLTTGKRGADKIDAHRSFWNETVMAELKAMHVRDQRFDHALLPIAAYFYELLGSDGIAELVERANDVHAGKQNWKWFLTSVPTENLSEVATALASSAALRKDRIDE